MGKIIAKTALITFLAIIVLIGAVGGMFIWLAPETVAKSCESLGFDSLSLKMYERTYKKDKTINNLHRVVDKSILFGGDETLLKYYPEFESHKDYEKFIQALDEANYDENAKVIVNLKLSNEGNRLKTRYVSALAKDDFEKAFTYAANDLFGINVLEDDFHYCIVGLAKYLNRANAELFGDVENPDDDTSWVNDDDLFGNNIDVIIADDPNKEVEENDYVEGSFSQWLDQQNQ